MDENGAARLLRGFRGARHDAVDSAGLLAAMLNCLDAIRGVVRWARRLNDLSDSIVRKMGRVVVVFG